MAQIFHTKINVQRKITSILLCQLCFNFLLYHTSKIQPLASNLKLISKILYEWYQGVANIRIFEYIRIFSGTNIHSYHIRIIFLMRIYSDIHSYEYSFVSYSYHFSDTNIFGYSFVLLFWYKYIRIFVRIIFLIRIYSDIHSYRFLDMNIFEYSFVSKIYIRPTLVWWRWKSQVFNAIN